MQESSELLAKLGETTIPADLPAVRRAAAEGSPAPEASGDQEDVTRKEDDNHAGGIVSAFWESLGEQGSGFRVQDPGFGLRVQGSRSTLWAACAARGCAGGAALRLACSLDLGPWALGCGEAALGA